MRENDIHIVPVRFRPSTITFMGRVRTDGSVSTRRGFGDVMMALMELDTAMKVVEVLLGGYINMVVWGLVTMKW